MLSSRKRKASPEKNTENSKSRKLKVSNKIFRSPTDPKPNSIAKTQLSKLLPEGYESIILTANTKPEENVEGNEAIYGCIRLSIITQEDALIWIKKFERKTSTSYRSQKTWKNDPKTGLYKRKFLCNNQCSNEPGGTNSCKACIIFTIKDAREIQTNPDYYLRDYPSQVIIQFCHNHKIDRDVYLRNLRPSTKLRALFNTYFSKGHSPFSALICHKCDLHSSYGSEFYDVVSNGGICPSYNWCYREYEKLFLRKFVQPQEDALHEKLREAVSQYNSKCNYSDCAVFSDSPNLVLSICTPLMKSVFSSGFAEDLITVRSFCTPKIASKRQQLILFLCHTPIGSLPFGIVLAHAENKNSICEGIKALLAMLGVASYTPKTIITDENSLITKSLKKCFAKSQILFNEFQMLQSIWRILRLVCIDDNEEFQTLYDFFLRTLNSASEEEFKMNFGSLETYGEKYPKLTNFLNYFKSRADSYVLYARPKVEFNTDVLNYTDSGTIILQDVSIKYGNFFNILQLFDFLTKFYVKHYERKLVKIVEGDLKGFFKTNFFVPLSKIADFTCEKISDTEFLVSLNGIKFFVNAELDTCTCSVGVHGGSCVHQYIVEKNLGLVCECYTPLGEDMLGIFKSILTYKQNELESDVETFNTDDVDDYIIDGSDVDNLGPLDEIVIAPTDVADVFIDEATSSSLDINEFEDPIEDNDEILNDSCQYNRDSGELEPNALQENAITFDHAAKVIQVDNSMVLSGYNITGDNSIVDELETPVFTYTTGNEDHLDIYEEVMTESDKKTAEIAEFLTNLPGTSNITYNPDPVVSAADYDVQEPAEASEVIEKFQQQITPSQEGVVVMKNDEFFTQYRVMENGVLSIVTDTDDDYTNQLNTFQTQNFIGDSYEETNLIMMSPSDLFDDNEGLETTQEDKSDSKINVLSSFVIKPPSANFISNAPLNLNDIKHKTLRNVKEDSRNKSCEGNLLVTDDNIDNPTLKTNSEDNKEDKLLSSVEAKVGEEKRSQPLPAQQESNQIEEECEAMNLTECDPAQLANESLADVTEMDSDDLEELAAQEYEPDIASTSGAKNTSVNDRKSPKKNSDFLEGQLTTAFSQLTNLANRNIFKPSVQRFLGKFKELGTGDKLISALESFGSDSSSGRKEIPLKSKLENLNRVNKVNRAKVLAESDTTSKDTDEYQEIIKKRYPYLKNSAFESSDSEESSIISSDIDEIDSINFEHYSDCRTSCSEFHSELEEIEALSDYELYELQLTKKSLPQNDDISKPKNTNTQKMLEASSKNKPETSRTFKGKQIPRLYRYIDADDDDSDVSDEEDVENKELNELFKGTKKLSQSHLKQPAAKGIESNTDCIKYIKNQGLVKGKGVSHPISPSVSNKREEAKVNLSELINFSKFKLGSEVSIVRIPPKNPCKQSVISSSITVPKNGTNTSSLTLKSSTELKVNQQSPKKATLFQDAKELETILMGEIETGSNHETKSKSNDSSILENEELAFLFDDPRFETIVVETDDIIPSCEATSQMYLNSTLSSSSEHNNSNAYSFKNVILTSTSKCVDKIKTVTEKIHETMPGNAKNTTRNKPKELNQLEEEKNSAIQPKNSIKGKVKNKNTLEDSKPKRYRLCSCVSKSKTSKDSKEIERRINKLCTPEVRKTSENTTYKKVQKNSKIGKIKASKDSRKSQKSVQKDSTPNRKAPEHTITKKVQRDNKIETSKTSEDSKKSQKSVQKDSTPNRKASENTVTKKVERDNKLETNKTSEDYKKSQKSVQKDSAPNRKASENTITKKVERDNKLETNKTSEDSKKFQKTVQKDSTPNRKASENTVTRKVQRDNKLETNKTSEIEKSVRKNSTSNRKALENSVNKNVQRDNKLEKLKELEQISTNKIGDSGPKKATLTPKKRPVQKKTPEKKTSEYNESLDFETSISASILEKDLTKTITSTPLKSIGYEDAFKRFLETSNEYHCEKSNRSFSDYENYLDESDSDSNPNGRRRARSVCTPKRRSSLCSKTPNTPKIKKSVSWAEGLNVLEYIKESETDSDGSEIISKDLKKRRRSKLSLPNKKIFSADSKTLAAPEEPKKRGRPKLKSPPTKKTFSKDSKTQTSSEEPRKRGRPKLRSPPTNKNFRDASNIPKTPRKPGRPSSSSDENLKPLKINTAPKKRARSRSSSPKRANAKSDIKPRFRNSTRIKTSKLELIVLLDRNLDIETMCQNVRKINSRLSRGRGGERVGYKQLLENAKRLKFS